MGPHPVPPGLPTCAWLAGRHAADPLPAAAVCEALHDLVPDGGRIVNVCSCEAQPRRAWQCPGNAGAPELAAGAAAACTSWLNRARLSMCHWRPLPPPPAAGKLGIIKDGALRARWERATSRAELDELTREFVEGVRADK